MGDIDWWVWLIIAVAAVLVIGVLVASLGRGRSVEHRRSEAAELREKAREAQEEAQARETEAAATRAKVEEAKVRADELERRADEQKESAAQLKDEARERLVKADRIDPDVEDLERVDADVDRDGIRSDVPHEGPRT